jgi:hypothetical protein
MELSHIQFQSSWAIYGYLETYESLNGLHLTAMSSVTEFDIWYLSITIFSSVLRRRYYSSDFSLS